MEDKKLKALPLDTSFCDSKQIKAEIEKRKREIMKNIPSQDEMFKNLNIEAYNRKNGLKPSWIPVSDDEKFKYKMEEIENANRQKRREFIKVITHAAANKI